MPDIDRTMGGKLTEMVAKSVAGFEQLMLHEAIHESCESEIEAMLGHAFFACDRLGPGFYPEDIDSHFKVCRNWHTQRGSSVNDIIECKWHDPFYIYAWPQVSAFGYTVDFMCFMHDYDWINNKSQKLLLAVECDGHEFHERTKEQARRDRSRDRALLVNNIPSMRFTGSEIWKNPYSCLQQIGDFFSTASINFYHNNKAGERS